MNREEDLFYKVNSVKDQLKKNFGKSHISLVSTGMAAIETALIATGVRKNDHVLLPAECCYTVPAGIIRVGAIPVFMETGKFFLLNDKLNWDLVNWHKIKAVIAIHEHGLPCDIKKLREIIPAIPIIEDASVAFGLKQADQEMGEYADFVVSSMGSGKPLDMMEGGILASGTEIVQNILSRRNMEMRYSETPPLPYAVSEILFKHLACRIPLAVEELKEKRESARMINEFMNEQGEEIFKLSANSDCCWHRIPVHIGNPERRGKLLASSTNQVIIQQLHAISTPDLPMFRNKHIRIATTDNWARETTVLIKSRNSQATQEWLNTIKTSVYGC